MYFIYICSYVIEDDLAPSRKNVWTVSIQYSYHQDQEVTLQLTYILCATFIHNTCCSTFTTMYIHMVFFIELLYHTTRRHTRQFYFNGTSCTLFWQFNYFLLSIVLLYNISSFNNQNIQTRTNKIIIQRSSNFQPQKTETVHLRSYVRNT